MKKQRSGRIIVTASIAGFRAETHVGYGYIATKAAIINVVRQAAMEMAPYGVSVNVIAPGPFLTNIADGRLHREPEVAIKATGDAVEEAFGALDDLLPDEVRRQRREKYLAIGRSL